MPKPASDRHLLTTTMRATTAAKEQLDVVRQAEKQHGRVWHVRIRDFKGDTSLASFDRHAFMLAPIKLRARRPAQRPKSGQPYVAVDFLVAQYDDDHLEILEWSISGFEVLTTRQSRFPLQTYARAALLAVEDALAADDVLDYETIMAQKLPYIGSLADDGAGWVYREYELVDGKIEDPRTGKPRTPARRKHVYPKNGGPELDQMVEEYRRAVERGSRSPTMDVARRFHVGRSTAARAIATAREQGLLGPALRNRAGEQT